MLIDGALPEIIDLYITTTVQLYVPAIISRYVYARLCPHCKNLLEHDFHFLHHVHNVPRN